MFEFTTTKTVAAPVERVFAIATDLRHAVGRIRAITKLDVLTEGPVGKGTRFRETRTMFGRPATEEMEITSFDPPHGYVVGCESHGTRYRTEFRFTPQGSSTEIAMTFSAEPLTTAAKVMSTMMKPFEKKLIGECNKDLDDLAAHAEGRTF